MQSSMISTRGTSLYGSQIPPVVFAFKTATFGPELQVSMGPSPHMSFGACKTAWLASDLLDSMGPSTHRRFLRAKQRLLDNNYKSLWVPDSTCGFSMQNSDFWTRITSLYGSQTWNVLLCMQNIVISARITSLYGSQPSFVVLCIQKSDFCTRISSLYRSQTSPVVSACKTSWLASELLVSMGPSPHLWFLNAKQRDFHQNYMPLWVSDLTCCFVQAKQRT